MAHPDPALQFDTEVALVEQLITHPAGFGLDYGGGLLVIHLSDEEGFEVEWDAMKDSKPLNGFKGFKAERSHEAATFFVKKRHELRLGVDFEAFDAPGPVEHERCPL